MDLTGLFKLSPAIVINYIKNKHNNVSWHWYDVWQEAHKKSFTVAKAMRADILQDLREAVEKAISEGQTFRKFQQEIQPILIKKGWWEKQFVVDTKGTAEAIQLGSLHRLKTIYRVNLQTAYQAGRYRTQIENTNNRPYWEYVAVMDQKTRPEHAQLNGLIFRYDDPFWSSFYPPNGWRCRCRVNALASYNLKNGLSQISSSNGCLSTELKVMSKRTGEKKTVTVYTDPITDKKIAPDVGWSSNPAA